MAHDSISFTISTQPIGQRHEGLLFNDHLEVENWMKNFDENDSTLDHLCLNKEGTRDLRTFLNTPEVVRFLEQ